MDKKCDPNHVKGAKDSPRLSQSGSTMPGNTKIFLFLFNLYFDSFLQINA